jgi:hypothetical protein
VTGPEHYRHAEELLAGATVGAGVGAEDVTLILHRAQVHATLAAAAATALSGVDQSGARDSTGYAALGNKDQREWEKAAGARRDG